MEEEEAVGRGQLVCTCGMRLKRQIGKRVMLCTCGWRRGRKLWEGVSLCSMKGQRPFVQLHLEKYTLKEKLCSEEVEAYKIYL